MTVEDVRAAIAASHRPHVHVKIGEDDGLPAIDNVSVLLRRADGTWFTAYFERGRCHDLRTFDSEDAACRDFLGMIDVPVSDGR